MAAPTEIYVDPAINANSGSGTIGDPYGDLQYAMNTATRDVANGNRVNIKAGAYEVLSSSLTYTGTYGNPSSVAPLIFQGYTSAAGDGGLGQIDFTGGSHLFCAVDDYVSWADLEMKNSTGTFLDLDAGVGAIVTGCVFHDTSGTAVDNTAIAGTGVFNCTFYDCAYGSNSGNVIGCRFYQGAIRNFVACITGITNAVACFNTFVIDGASNAINSLSYARIFNNSIFSNGGTGYGIGSFSAINMSIYNNLVEGFSGAGGVGIYADSLTTERAWYCSNSAYNNTTDFSSLDSLYSSGNESLGSSPFVDAANGDFTPVDVGGVLGGGWPGAIGSQTMNINRGAVQSAAGGGSSRRHAPFSGGISG